MADTKITALTALTAADPANDVIPIVDVSDTTMAASGTTKKISVNNILGASGTATLASATITGDLTVDTSTLKVDSTNNRVIVGHTSGSAAFQVTNAGAAGLEIQPTGFSSSPLIQSYNRSGSAYTQLTLDASTIVHALSGTTAMTLNSTGLGVGGSPSYKLSAIGTTNNQVVLHVGNTAGSSDGDTTNVVRFAAGSGANALWANARYDGFSHAWRCNSTTTQAMTLDSSGNVGVGVTPSAWSGITPIQISRGSFAADTGSFILSQNVYNNGSNRYIATAAAMQFQAIPGTGFLWNIAPSGTAGNAITFTQAMTLDASGNLLVGNTSNPNTARAYFRYDTLTTQPVINSASIVAAGTGWNHFVGQSGNGSTVTTNNIFIRGNGDVVNANGVYGTISDLRLKENISDARNYLADLLKLRVVKYSLKSEESDVATKIGFIAQEVEQVFPSLITTDTDDNKSIKTSVLIPMLLKAIQELTARVEALEA